MVKTIEAIEVPKSENILDEKGSKIDTLNPNVMNVLEGALKSQ